MRMSRPLKQAADCTLVDREKGNLAVIPLSYRVALCGIYYTRLRYFNYDVVHEKVGSGSQERALCNIDGIREL